MKHFSFLFRNRLHKNVWWPKKMGHLSFFFIWSPFKFQMTSVCPNNLRSVCVHVDSVPVFLHSSIVYQQFVQHEAEPIYVPTDCYKSDDSIANMKDLIHLIKTVRFWLLDHVPMTVMKYALDFQTRRHFVRVLSHSQWNEWLETTPDWKNLMCVTKEKNLCGQIICAIEKRVSSSLLMVLIPKTPSSCNSKQIKAILFTACKQENQTVLNYALENEWPLSSVEFCQCASRHGQLECLQTLLEHNCPVNYFVCCVSAAKGGHLRCLQYLQEKNTDFPQVDCSFCREAAKSGHLECLSYLHESGYPWNEGVCLAAAKGGHLNCLQFLHENGCPWNYLSYVAAEEYGHMECLKFLQEHGCERSITYSYYLNPLEFQPSGTLNVSRL